MTDIPWDLVLTVAGIAVPIAAFLWEFVVVGEKRLGYRVQMDTVATEVLPGQHAGVLERLSDVDGDSLTDPSFVLLRIENDGTSHIDSADYAAPEHDPVGLGFTFPGRRVAGMLVTELSDENLRRFFRTGLSAEGGTLELPRVPLNRTDHYKVLVVLERDGTGAQALPPVVVGGIKGGAVRRFTGRLANRMTDGVLHRVIGRTRQGVVEETISHTGVPRRVIALVTFLVLIVAGQFALGSTTDAAPLDCASGTVELFGSTAFRPVLEEAAATYGDLCPDAHFAIKAEGSAAGLESLRGPDQIAFSDGRKDGAYPNAVQRPVAFMLFTLVGNPGLDIEDLGVTELKEIYNGDHTDWQEARLRDEPLPIRLVDRVTGSGTRTAFEKRVLGRAGLLPGDNSRDCLKVDGGGEGVVRCRKTSTKDLLDAVGSTPGALGYAELGLAEARGDAVKLITIDNESPTLEAAEAGIYPFWETEYAYTFKHPAASSLAAGFLRFLTMERGLDIIRAHAHHPCADLDSPAGCRPT
ncbi:phosphate ABC transporter substrate-binding protein (PhoT family) [Actinocorallia herbida]|uniref:Phosphate ABC transporter substrate-binding protein (PhoT family) n=1 Tax=Actinocorallia herbida TaxID=58109 RepID=A0A3N1DBC1_9ACTN|nr:substrate-binding domain-containing protein [Actinocorallia herbida]ROO90799.1 phosphate ABC transporter substrate-binding protein (PhoT family) [Actinocorallia herbida]